VSCSIDLLFFDYSLTSERAFSKSETPLPVLKMLFGRNEEEAQRALAEDGQQAKFLFPIVLAYCSLQVTIGTMKFHLFLLPVAAAFSVKQSKPRSTSLGVATDPVKPLFSM
jgi:hypothetical protein